MNVRQMFTQLPHRRCPNNAPPAADKDDKNGKDDKADKRIQIRFPPFHAEVLTQVWANPAQGMGTIKVVLAEGINQGSAESVSFMKLRNIVTFSFQHAPLREQNCRVSR